MGIFNLRASTLITQIEIARGRLLLIFFYFFASPYTCYIGIRACLGSTLHFPILSQFCVIIRFVWY